MMTPAHYQTSEFRVVDKLIARLVENRKTPLRVLDFGCGRGKYLACFAAHHCSVVAVDTNDSYVAMARDQGFQACSPEQLFDGAESAFDLIFLSHVIEHLAPDQLMNLIPKLCQRLRPGGLLMLVSPTPGERFFHDFSHVRPYLPQSIRHAFGQTGSPLSFGEKNLIELIDIHFFRDPFRTRLWRSFYVDQGVKRTLTKTLNRLFDFAWQISGGRFGITASWLGIYQMK